MEREIEEFGCDGTLGQSCGLMGDCEIKSTTKHNITRMGCLVREQFGKQTVSTRVGR